MTSVVLVRYGTIPEVARFAGDGLSPFSRGEAVMVETHRGLQLGTVLQEVPHRTAPPPLHRSESSEDREPSFSPVVRRATEADRAAEQELREQARQDFDTWSRRISEWELELELIDLEWTADRKKLILYVLNDRGPDCTKLAIRAAAAGLGLIEVQPVAADGLVTSPSSGGGCGTCGCH